MAKRLIKEADAAAEKASREAKTWKRELQLADKREKPWRDESEKIVKRYRGEERKKNRFNVLWANTEILRPAIYNTKPNPDVRRRFRDADPVGKAVSEVVERSLYVVLDQESSETGIRNDVLDAMLCGRGVSWVKYEAKVNPGEEATEDYPGSDESLEFEGCCIDHVDWRDYREGYGRTWQEVPWIGRRHKLTKADAKAKFGQESIHLVQFTVPSNDTEKNQTDENNETAKVAEFWEIWDKDHKRVFFTNEQCDSLLYPLDNLDGEPPIDFPDFYPCPDPLCIIENTGSRIPIPHFTLYQAQADELDKLSLRIDRIVDKLRLRGVYDATLKEIGSLMDSTDNEMVPVENAAKWMNSGGLEKALNWMPVEQAAQVLIALNEARDKQKTIIDELTGISDIIRGVTDANETYGAQQLKSNYASVRLQRMQKEVQRYCRDLMRLCAVVIAKFGQDTLAAMTDLKFPTAQEKAQLQQQAQMAQQPPQPGMPPPQPVDTQLLQIPSWDEILQLLQSEKMRQFRIDIETDSTIAGVLDSDMAGITEVMNSVGTILERMAPAVTSGSLPVDAAKELIMSVIRRARLGMAVEDAFEKMKAPDPVPPPPDHSVEVAQIKAQSDKEIETMKLQAAEQQTVVEHQAIAQTEQGKNQIEAQRHTLEIETKARLDMLEKEHAAQLEQLKLESNERIKAAELENARLIADANNQTQLMIAELAAQQKAQAAQQQQAHDLEMAKVTGQQQSEQQDKQLKHEQSTAEAPTAAAYSAVESQFIPVMQELIKNLNKPKTVVRGPDGKIVGVQ